jgi:hypothetical protein
MHVKKTWIFAAVFILATVSVSADQGDPEWFAGRWKAENGQVWKIDRIEGSSEGSIKIQEDGQAVAHWGWRHRSNNVYLVKRYYGRFESFVLQVRAEDEFRFRAAGNSDEHWILHRADGDEGNSTEQEQSP